MEKKLLITALCTLACFFSLCLVASAVEYTVGGSNSDYATVEEAEAVAESGDTIIIEADIDKDVNLTKSKSLELVLKGNLNGGLRISYATATEVVITIRTEGEGNRTIYFKKSNDYSQGILGGGYGNNLKTKYTLNFVGTENSKLILNGESYDYGLVSSAMPSVHTHFKHTEVTGFDTTNGTKVVYGSTANLYEGAKFYNNNTVDALMGVTTLNIYGGEICNNTVGGARMFDLKNVNMYGGSIHDNYMTSTSAVAIMEYTYANENSYRFYEGKIYNNYLDSTNSPSIVSSSKWSSKSIIMATCVGDNYYYSASDSTVEPTAMTKKFNNLSYTDLEYTVIFKNNDSSLVSAYGKGASAYFDQDGTSVTEITVPEGQWASKINYCQPTTPVTNVQGTYYVVVAHTFAEDDFNCETGDTCIVCKAVLEGNTHVIVENIEYASGFLSKGVYTYECTNEGCSACDITREVSAIFTCLGFTKTEIGTKAVLQGFVVNRVALQEYNSISENDIIGYGLVAGTASNLGANAEVLENGAQIQGTKAIVKSFADTSFDIMEIKITGLEGTTGTEYTNTELYCGGYFVTEDKESSYVTADDNNTIYVTDTLTTTITFEKIPA